MMNYEVRITNDQHRHRLAVRILFLMDCSNFTEVHQEAPLYSNAVYNIQRYLLHYGLNPLL